jgi:hypothetical protein
VHLLFKRNGVSVLDWIHLTYDWVHTGRFCGTVTGRQVPRKTEDHLNGWVTISFSRPSVLHVVNIITSVTFIWRPVTGFPSAVSKTPLYLGVTISNLGQETSYFHGILVTFFSPSTLTLGCASSSTTGAIFLILSNSSFDNHPTTQRYTVWATVRVVKYIIQDINGEVIPVHAMKA